MKKICIVLTFMVIVMSLTLIISSKAIEAVGWITPSGGSGSGWSSGSLARDNNLGTKSWCFSDNAYTYSNAGIWVSSVRLSYDSSVGCSNAKIEIYKDGEWETIYDGGCQGGEWSWHTIGFDTGLVTQLRITITSGVRNDLWEGAWYQTDPPPCTPSVDTDAATGADISTATLWGDLTDNCTSTTDWRGFAWGNSSQGLPSDATAPNASAYDDSWVESGSFAEEAFSRLVSGLGCNGEFFFRAAAHGTEDGGTWGWGSELSFNTSGFPECEPSVTTVAASLITGSTATINGTITDNCDTGDCSSGNCDTRGFVWDTSSHGTPGNTTAPSISDYDSYWTEGGDYGNVSFDHGLTSLHSATTIYYRAAVRSGSEYWGYGSELSFNTSTYFEDACTENILYEYYTSGCENSVTIYGTDMVAQTFEAQSDHTIASVRLMLYRTGDPGDIEIEIMPVGIDGHPIQPEDSWSVATLDGGTLTDSSDGEMVCFELTPELILLDGSDYAISLRAEDGDVSNYVNWIYNTSGSYSDGNYEYSEDEGATWDDVAVRDLWFEVYGFAGLGISDVKIFADVIEHGDLYFAILYRALRPGDYPLTNPEAAYDVILEMGNGTSQVAKRPLPAWGLAPTSLYLSPSTRASYGIMWKGADYSISLEGPVTTDYEIEDSDWVGPYVWQLCDDWVINTARALETFYAIDLVLDSYGGEILEKPILDIVGGQIFLIGMPGLEDLCPYSFYAIEKDPGGWEDIDYSGSFEIEHDWVTTFGGEDAQIPMALEAVGGVFGLTGKMVGGIGLLALMISMMATVARRNMVTGAASMVLVVLILAVGAWMGLIAYAAIGVASIIAITFMAWVLWFSR